MMRYRRPASAVRRIRNRLIPGAVAAVALIIAWVLASHGTLTIWKDTAAFRDVSLTAGSPRLTVTGFDQLDHDYELDAREVTATVIVKNTGDVELHDFEAMPFLTEDSSPLLHNAIETTFTPLDHAGDVTGWKGWLDGLTLAPNAERTFAVKTALEEAELAPLHKLEVTVDVAVEATAGKSWTIVTDAGYAQAVFHEPPVDEIDFNLDFPGPTSGYDMVVEFVWPSQLDPDNQQHMATEFTIWVDGKKVASQAWMYWNRRFTLSTSNLPAAGVTMPGNGQTREVVVEVTMGTPPQVVARGTLWLIGEVNNFRISSVPPVQRMSALAPATGAQQTAATETETGAGAAKATAPTVEPAPTTPTPAPEPEPTGPAAPAEPTQPADPSAPAEPATPAEPAIPAEPTPPVEPEVPPTRPEIALNATARGGEIDLDWDGSTELPAGTVFTVKAVAGDDEITLTAGTARTFTLTTDELAPLVPAGGEAARELTITVTAEVSDQTVAADTTIWARADGLFTEEPAPLPAPEPEPTQAPEPEASAPPEES